MQKIKDFVIPQPKKVEGEEKYFKINGVKVTGFSCECEVFLSAVEKLNSLGCGEYEVNFEKKEVSDGRKEAYTLEIKEDKAVICANDTAGLFYGAVTFCAIAGQGEVPVCYIEDYPDFYDRGLMLENRYGSDFMTLDDYKKAIDYFADMKYNQLTVGVYGCWCVQYDMRLSEFLYIPIKSHPELKTPRDIRYWSPEKNDFVIRENVLPTIFCEDYLGDLIKYAKTKNIKVKPLFNSFGHNTLIPRLHPELSAKDENGNPTKHGYCVSNEKVFEFMFDIYDEIIDRYLTPNGIDSIEIGLDEVYAWLGEDLDDIYGKFEPYCKCEKCRSMDRKELMLTYIIKVCKYLKSKGIKSVYIYHDMLFEQFDIVNEELVELFKKEGIYDIVVLDWWCYSKDEDLFQKREINGLFRSISKPFTGYYHWVVPMEYNANIHALAVLAKKHNFEGIESYSSFEYCFDRPFMYQAQLSWNTDITEDYEGFLNAYANARFSGEKGAKEALDIMAELTANDKVTNRMNALEYYWFTYVAEGEDYPRNFHGGVFKKILDDREGYVSYFENTIEKANKAMKFFEESKSEFAPVWYTIAEHYYNYSYIYLTMINIHDEYVYRRITKDEVADALEELLDMHENFMADVEATRIEANSYVYLRNHSITRQLLVDLIYYFDSNEKPHFDLLDFSYCLSDTYRKLR